ncbi:ATP synthase complex subunit H-domain-containing protein [Jimgerdemannia flammicorona]|uniref:ATP synthase complex subunit H-domain-containing protein n=1 Tax=Jimgerdemannia flammicorona TaxID=994334 RepID=A0A433QPX2_9FUNG|nr:ATP synthase complex subunit H-domain-containing protein [Jimgerdemannia flammicorona]
MSFLATRFLARSALIVTPVVRSAVRPTVPVMALRNFTAPSAPARKDVVQDLYIKELKNYKPVEEKTIEAGQVKDLHLPLPPPVPDVKEDLSAELATYDAEDVEELAVEDSLLEEDVEEEIA